MSPEQTADYANADECPLGPCEHPVVGYGCEFQRGCGEMIRRAEDNGYSLVRTGDVPPWMERNRHDGDSRVRLYQLIADREHDDRVRLALPTPIGREQTDA